MAIMAVTMPILPGKKEMWQKLMDQVTVEPGRTEFVKSRDEGKKAMYMISNEQLSQLITKVTKTSKEIPNLCLDENCC